MSRWVNVGDVWGSVVSSLLTEFRLHSWKQSRLNFPPAGSDCFCSHAAVFSLNSFLWLFYWILKICFVFQQNSVYVRLHFLLSLYETLLIIDQRLLRLLNLPDDEFCFRRAHCSRPSHWLMTVLIVLMTSLISVAQSGSELSSDHLWPLTCFYVHIINSALKITPYLTPPLRHSDITREFFFYVSVCVDCFFFCDNKHEWKFFSDVSFNLWLLKGQFTPKQNYIFFHFL